MRAAVRCKRAIQRLLVTADVRLAEADVRTKCREHEPQEFWRFVHRSRDAVQASQPSDELRIPKVPYRGVSIGEVRSARTGNEQMNWLSARGPAQFASQFERDKRAHAVAGERERLVEQRGNRPSEIGDEQRELRVGRLAKAAFPAGKRYRNYRDRRWQSSFPVAEHRRAAASERQAEKTKRWTRLDEKSGGPGHIGWSRRL